MASGQTHIMLAQKALTELIENSSVKNYLQAFQEWTFIGAVGPDLPYLSILDTDFLEEEKFLADLFHYKRTNELVIEGLSRIKKSKEDAEIKAAKFAFLMGFASHIIVDGIVHPFVRDKVGDYEGNEAKHRELELGLDVILMDDVQGLDLNSTNFHQIISLYEDSEYKDHILSFFKELSLDIYKGDTKLIGNEEQIHTDKINGWIKALKLSLEIAESDSYPNFYKKLMSKLGAGYLDMKDIAENKSKYSKLDIPIDATEKGLKDNFLNRGKKIDFLEDIYPLVTSEVTKFWSKAFEFTFNNGDSPEFKAINLDTGRLLSNDNLSEVPYYWRNYV